MFNSFLHSTADKSKPGEPCVWLEEAEDPTQTSLAVTVDLTDCQWHSNNETPYTAITLFIPLDEESAGILRKARQANPDITFDGMVESLPEKTQKNTYFHYWVEQATRVAKDAIMGCGKVPPNPNARRQSTMSGGTVHSGDDQTVAPLAVAPVEGTWLSYQPVRHGYFLSAPGP